MNNNIQNEKYKLANPLLMWLIVVIGFIVIYFIVAAGDVFAPSPWGVLVLALGFINLVYISVISFRVHQKAAKSVAEIDSIITEGVYAVVRHPMYAADILFALTVFVYRPSFKVLAAVIWLSVVLLFWAKLEERMLEEKFIEDYQRYRTRVPMVIPKFWGRAK
jgi:protein-S-isoprenylcysteine O-methyltransferase Ste14